MFIRAGIIVLVYFIGGYYVFLDYDMVVDYDANPLWKGLCVIFWPVAILIGIIYCIKQYIEEIIEYYKKKGKKKE